MRRPTSRRVIGPGGRAPSQVADQRDDDVLEGPPTDGHVARPHAVLAAPGGDRRTAPSDRRHRTRDSARRAPPSRCSPPAGRRAGSVRSACRGPRNETLSALPTSSSTVPCRMSRPPAMTTTRSASRSTSSMRCVVSTMVVPPATRLRTRSWKARRPVASRPAVGSSRKASSGRPTSAAGALDALLLAAGQAADGRAHGGIDRRAPRAGWRDRRRRGRARPRTRPARAVGQSGRGRRPAASRRRAPVHAARAAPDAGRSVPSTSMVPPEANGRRPTQASTVEVLPAPLGPTRAVTAPPGASKESPETPLERRTGSTRSIDADSGVGHGGSVGRGGRRPGVGARGELGNNDVMQFPGEAAERVARALLQAGPSTAAELAEALGHVDRRACDARSMSSSTPASSPPMSARRTAPRPSGAGAAGQHVRPDRPRAGPPATRPTTTWPWPPCGSCPRSSATRQSVESFAYDRARQLADAVVHAGIGSATPQDVADALSGAGYAAEVRPLGDVAVQLCQHHCPVVDAAREFPVLCEAETAELGRVLGRHVTRLATLAHGDEVCTAVIPSIEAGTSVRDPSPRKGIRMSTAAQETAASIDDIGRYEFGWSDATDAGANARRGLNEDVVRDISAKKNEPDWMLQMRLKGLRLFEKKPMPTWGSEPRRHRLRQHQVLRAVDGEAGRRAGRTCRTTSRTPTTAWASPRPRSSGSSPASPPSTSPRSSTTRSARTSRSRASCSSTPTPPCASTRTSSRSTSARSSRWATTSSPRSTPPCGRAAPSSTCPRASRSTSRCRPTSGSTPRTWASSSAR